MQEDYHIYEKQNLASLSENIKKFRELRGYSQELLAEKAGCTREFINRIENKKEDLSLKMLLKLSYVLEIKLKDFI